MAAVAGGRITAGVGANLIGQHAADRNQDATVYVGGLDPQVLHNASSVTPALAGCVTGPMGKAAWITFRSAHSIADVRGARVGAVCASWTCR